MSRNDCEKFIQRQDMVKDMGGKSNYESLLLAAVVHDIGKFWQGTGEKGTHQELGVKFVRMHFPEQWQGAAGLISLHHDAGKIASEGYELLKILMISDWLSAGEREDREEDKTGKRINEPLISIFSEIDIGKGIPAEKLRFPLKKLALDEETIFPKEMEGKLDLKEDYKILWDEFVYEVEALKDITDSNKYFNKLYFISQKYMWGVPSAVYKDEPDISLFDHLKTTSAISACLYKFHEASDHWGIDSIEDRQTSKFLLIGGDISGIQKYIYEIASIGVGGVAKRLRARSFYISMISEVMVHRLLDELKLPITCNIIASGGRFFILAPNTDEIKTKIRNIKINVSKWLLEEFYGNLYLNLEFIEFAGKDLEIGKTDFEEVGFSRIFDRLSDCIDNAKHHKFIEILASDGKWHDTFKTETNIFEMCKSCGKMPRPNDQDICNRCDFDEKIGRWLLDAKFIAFSKEKPNNECIPFFSDVPYYVSIIRELNASDYYSILKLNDLDTGKEADGFKLIANHVYSLKNDRDTDVLCSKVDCSKIDECELRSGSYYPRTVSFDCIAQLSEGKPLIGVLKADVDNLGLIFSMGLKKSNKNDIDRDTISRVTMLSRLLDLYFTGWIQYLVQSRYPNCYIVYSGGDDLLITGPWNEIIELSQKINEDFKKYSCENPNVTLSAGIFLSKSSFPLARSSKLVDEVLEESKKGDKNQITLFEKTVAWRKHLELMDYGRFLDEELKKNKDGKSPINSSFVNRLLRYCKMADEGDFMYLSRIKYDIARNIMSKNSDNKENESRIVRKLMKMRDEMPDMIIPVSYALYKNREENK